MRGHVTFIGTGYRANVLAYVHVHVLAQTPLGWTGPVDVAPQGVSGETDGPGDDGGVEFGAGRRP